MFLIRRIFFFIIFTACKNPADVVLALDRSGSIGPASFQKQIDFAKNLVANLNLHNMFRVGYLSYGNFETVSSYHVYLINSSQILLDANRYKTMACVLLLEFSIG